MLLIGAVMFLLSLAGLAGILAAPGGGMELRAEPQQARITAMRVPEPAAQDDDLAADFAEYLFLHESRYDGAAMRVAAGPLCTE